MIIEQVDVAIAELRRLIGESRRGLAFTGAGISTECGIPDFRSPGSPWLTNKPIPFDVFVASAAARAEAWRRKFAIDDAAHGVAPGRGHKALASLVRAGHFIGVVTQNIDGLHHASGLNGAEVVELHGNGTYAKCLDCGQRHELAFVREHFEATGQAPLCQACGGIVKSATISFGQAMPEAEMRRAQQMTQACDLFVAIGSSLVVWPAASLPMMAQDNGALLVIINRDPTPFDDQADLVVRTDIGAVLEPFIHT